MLETGSVVLLSKCREKLRMTQLPALADFRSYKVQHPRNFDFTSVPIAHTIFAIADQSKPFPRFQCEYQSIGILEIVCCPREYHNPLVAFTVVTLLHLSPDPFTTT